jgi:ABC-2 type transport system permease protein
MSAVSASTRRAGTDRPMNGWRLEWLRLRRSARGVALLGVFGGYGLLGPVLARYLAVLVRHLGARGAVTVSVRPPVPADGITTYVQQVHQVGLVVVVVVATGALAFDSRPGISTFFRTRARSTWQLVLPRFVVPALAAVLAYTLGTLAAWYETALLIGPVPTAPLLAGLLCQSLFLVFAVAVVAAAAASARSTLATIGLSLAVLLLLPVLGMLGRVGDWLPSSLADAPTGLLGPASIGDYASAVATTLVLTPALLVGAVRRQRRRDL